MKPVTKTTKAVKTTKTKAQIAKDKAFADVLSMLDVADHLVEHGEEELASEIRVKVDSISSFILNGK